MEDRLKDASAFLSIDNPYEFSISSRHPHAVLKRLGTASAAPRIRKG
jgi:hypothetical protein